MLHFKNIFFIFLLLVGFTACSHPTTEEFHTKMNNLRGSHIDTMIPVWGPPLAKHTYQDGRTAYKWQTQSTDMWPETSYYPGNGTSAFSHWPSVHNRLHYGGHNRWGYAPYYYGGIFMVNRPMVLVHSCTLTVTTDKAGIIQSHEAVGDDCVS